MDILYYIGFFIIMIWSFSVQSTLKSRVNKGSQIQAASGKTANDVVREMLSTHEVYGITIEHKPGEMTDCYSPKEGKIYLSDTTYNKSTVSAIAVAAHEAGHAVQHAEGMLIYQVRQFLAPVAGIAARGGTWIAILGLILAGVASRAGDKGMFNLSYGVINVGLLVYCVSFLFYLVMLPVERNASNRAFKDMKKYNWVGQDQLKIARKLLTAAGDTYAIALASSALTLFRLILMRNRVSGGRRR